MRRIVFCFVALATSFVVANQPAQLQKLNPEDAAEKEARKFLKPVHDKLYGDRGTLMDGLLLTAQMGEQMHNDFLNIVGVKLKHADPKIRAQALRTIGQLGIKDEHSRNVELQYKPMLDDPDEEVLFEACIMMGRIRPFSKPALPKLVELTKHKTNRVRRAAVTAVGGLATWFKEAIPPLIAALDDPDPGDGMYAGTVYGALYWLMQCKADAKDAAPKIKNLLADTKRQHSLHNCALRTLIAVHPQEPTITTTLKEWLNDKKQPSYRADAASLVSEPSFHVNDVLVPELIAALGLTDAPKDVDFRIKLALTGALQRIGPAAKDAIPALEAISDYDDEYIRSEIRKTVAILRGLPNQ